MRNYYKKLFLFCFLSLIILSLFNTDKGLAQVKGEETKKFNPDTVFVFESPRPLISSSTKKAEQNEAWGLDLLFSNNGFGLGTFYQYNLAKDLFAFASLYISGARNTDELEYYNPNTGRDTIFGKINRLYMFPLTIGLQQFLFTDIISESLKMFVQGGFGPTFILATPYEREFFTAFGYAKFYTRFGTFIGLGADVGTGTSIFSINARYYYIPFGGYGLESIKDKPIKDFGGLFLSISLGTKF